MSPTGVRGVVLDVTPAVPGLTVTAIEDGARLLVRNETGTAVDVPPGDGQAVPVPVPPGATVTWIDARATTLDRDLGAAATRPWTVPVTGPLHASCWPPQRRFTKRCVMICRPVWHNRATGLSMLASIHGAWTC